MTQKSKYSSHKASPGGPITVAAALIMFLVKKERTVTELAKLMDTKPATVRKHLHAFEEEGLVDCQGSSYQWNPE